MNRDDDGSGLRRAFDAGVASGTLQTIGVWFMLTGAAGLFAPSVVVRVVWSVVGIALLAISALIRLGQRP